MPAIVRAACAMTAITFALGSPAGAEDKSTKPRIAVLELQAGAQLEVESAQWGEWIADVERPQEAARVNKVDAFSIKQKAVEEDGQAGRANDRLRTAGPKDDWPSAAPAAPGEAEITLKGNTAPATTMGNTKWKNITLKRGTSAASGEKGGTEDINIGVGGLQESRGGVTVAAGDVTGDGGGSASPKKPTTRPLGLVPGGTKPIPSASGAPLDRGSVMLRLAQPWAGCAVGNRFDGIYLTTGATHKYRLDGAEIVGCGGSTVTINYTRFAAEGQPVR